MKPQTEPNLHTSNIANIPRTRVHRDCNQILNYEQITRGITYLTCLWIESKLAFSVINMNTSILFPNPLICLFKFLISAIY